MKYIHTTILIFGLVIIAQGQAINDSISMEQLYTNQVYYSLDNGEVASINNNDWELGFSMYGNGAAGSAILLNEANTTLWAYPGDTANWSSLDTVGHANWEQLLNTDTSWTNGAFNLYRGAGGGMDLGWGILNPQNNYWTFGDSLYVAKLSDNSYRKLWIISLKSGVWEFKYANIDGSNEQSFTIDKNNYSNRNFVYHSMLTEQTIDREPDNTTWDILFAKHTDYIAYAFQYASVTSVFSNRNVWSAKANETDYTAASTSTTPQTSYNQRTTNIGREWKKYSSSTGWVVYDSIAYFIYDNDSTDFYRMVFTDFDGMSTGKAFFNLERIPSLSVNELEFDANISIYPNPAINSVSLLIDYPENDNLIVSIYNLSGKEVFQKTISLTAGVNQKHLQFNDLSEGIYVINLKNSNLNSSQKLIIK